MGQTIYKNAKIYGKIMDFAVEDGKFCKIGNIPGDGIDMKERDVFPGLIDIHTHGCMGVDAMDNQPEELSRIYASTGVTSFLPTTVTAGYETLKTITDADISNVTGAQILGFHLEGPHIATQYKGAQNPGFICPPNLQTFSRLKNVTMVTVAPEIAGCLDFIQNCNCRVCIGHTAANYDTAIAAIEAGASCLTHTFNAMAPLHHRNPGAIGAAMDKNIYAQVICDGLHVHPAVLRMLYKVFGPERLILISDSMRACGLKSGKYDLGGLSVVVKYQQARLADGTLAGSVATLMDCVKNAISFGIPKEDAFRMASETPAAYLNVPKGKIEVGYDADFLVLDENLTPVKVFIGGKEFQ